MERKGHMTEENTLRELIQRTQAIVREYNGDTDTTLLINCCVGLLIIPKEKWFNFLPKENVNNECWGISPTGLCKKSKNRRNSDFDTIPNDYSVKNVATHIRNAIAHARFMTMSDGENIVRINLYDKNGKKEIAPTNFQLEISVENFKKFVLKLSQTMLDTMEQQP